MAFDRHAAERLAGEGIKEAAAVAQGPGPVSRRFSLCAAVGRRAGKDERKKRGGSSLSGEGGDHSKWRSIASYM